MPTSLQSRRHSSAPESAASVEKVRCTALMNPEPLLIPSRRLLQLMNPEPLLIPSRHLLQFTNWLTSNSPLPSPIRLDDDVDAAADTAAASAVAAAAAKEKLDNTRPLLPASPPPPKHRAVAQHLRVRSHLHLNLLPDFPIDCLFRYTRALRACRSG